MKAFTAAANRPAADRDVLGLLEALFQHYPPLGGEAGQKQRWADWLEDVGHLPADVLRDACKAWRQGDNRWAPNPGQLLALVDKGYLADEKLIDMAIRALEPSA